MSPELVGNFVDAVLSDGPLTDTQYANYGATVGRPAWLAG
eukprot:SAG22_NODE_2587_length_2410_cov_4.925573_3_plen_40_part_00